MERIKDWIHDYSDVFLGILIAAAMFMVVYINLNTIFDESTAVVPQPGIATGQNDLDSEAPMETIVIDLSEPNDPDASEESIPEDRHEPGAQEPEPTPEPPAEPVPPPATGQMVTVTIPNGTPGIGIARILVEHQLLTDTGPFVQAAESLDLSLKLKSGTFQIPAGSSPETMVRIIAGQ